MTLNASGAIYLGTGGAGQSVQTEYSLTPPFTMDDVTVRTDAGVASGAYSLSQFYGRSSVVTVSISTASPNFGYVYTTMVGTCYGTITLNPDGTSSGYHAYAPSWATTPAAGIGAYVWVRVSNLSTIFLTTLSGSMPANTWVSLSTAQSFTITRTGVETTGAIQLDFSSSATGSPIIATKSISIDLGYNKPNPCPATWVPILVIDEDGILFYKRADEIHVGDLVWTIPDGGSELGAYPVEAVSIAENSSYRLEMEDGRVLVFSPHHRLNTINGWVEIQNLVPGDEIVGTSSGKVKQVTPEGLIEVVRITVSDAHTYITDGLLSHNTKMILP